MSLNPSIHPNGFDSVATLQALLVVTPRGRVQFATPRARLWLRDLVPSASTPERLPESVSRWLASGISGGHPSKFILNAPGAQVRLQVLCREGNSVCLLLERSSQILSRDFPPSPLTERQVEVLSWVAQGKTNAEIGEILSLKPGTIGKYLERIFPKLGVENRTAAASFVTRTNATS